MSSLSGTSRRARDRRYRITPDDLSRSLPLSAARACIHAALDELRIDEGYSRGRGHLRWDDTYRFDVQLSENASALVENGRFSRSRFQDLPAACLPLRVSRVPSAGTSTVHTP
jgi:hypothetical protein